MKKSKKKKRSADVPPYMREGEDGDPTNPSGRCNPPKLGKMGPGKKPRGEGENNRQKEKGRRKVREHTKRQPTVRNPPLYCTNNTFRRWERRRRRRRRKTFPRNHHPLLLLES